ncbi:MAG: hypothetical protein IPJ23_15375 [Ignavibacteriales bacterium]|nr:hypothetical protein [Ignavibacteriales bacterium]
MKKYTVKILITCLLLQFTGCYSMQELQKDEFFERAGNENVQIKTNSGEKILFLINSYIVRTDSIVGKGAIISNYEGVPDKEFEGSIAVDQVESFQMEDFSIIHTIGGVMLLGYLGTALVLGILSGFH